MNLEQGEKARRRMAEQMDVTPAVFRDVLLIVLRADTAVQAGMARSSLLAGGAKSFMSARPGER
jgi:hypothetical protein